MSTANLNSPAHCLILSNSGSFCMDWKRCHIFISGLLRYAYFVWTAGNLSPLTLIPKPNPLLSVHHCSLTDSTCNWPYLPTKSFVSSVLLFHPCKTYCMSLTLLTDSNVTRLMYFINSWMGNIYLYHIIWSVEWWDAYLHRGQCTASVTPGTTQAEKRFGLQ